MNEQQITPPPLAKVVGTDEPGMPRLESTRVFIFLGIQIGFLIASPLTGGFHNKVWSMLDSAILISSIGITGLLFVLDGARVRRIVFGIAVVLYVLAIIDMSVNVLMTGWLGWEKIGTG